MTKDELFETLKDVPGAAEIMVLDEHQNVFFKLTTTAYMSLDVHPPSVFIISNDRFTSLAKRRNS